MRLGFSRREAWYFTGPAKPITTRVKSRATQVFTEVSSVARAEVGSSIFCEEFTAQGDDALADCAFGGVDLCTPAPCPDATEENADAARHKARTKLSRMGFPFRRDCCWILVFGFTV